MLGNRRNLIFRVSIVINIAVILYAAMQLSGTPSPTGEWIPVTADGTDRTDARYTLELKSPNTLTETGRPAETSFRNSEETTSTKTPSTPPSTSKTIASNKTVVTTVTETETKQKSVEVITSSEPEPMKETSVEPLDDTILTDATLTKLENLLQCREREFKYEVTQRGEFWVLQNYIRAEHGPLACHETVTYTTHAGFEFLDNVQPLVERWMGPVSLAVFASGSDFLPAVDSIRYLRDCLRTDLVRQFVTFHLFFSYKHVPTSIPDADKLIAAPFNCTDKPPYSVDPATTYMKKKELLYPVNVARNIARDAAMTHFVLASDIELYPSPNLISRFLNMIARNQKPLSTSQKPRVFPISIFEVDSNATVPSTKTELQEMLKKKTAIPFHKHLCPGCHNIPEAAKWMTNNETDQMDVFHIGKRRGKFVHWEPIFIGTHSDPHYDERLSWEGKQDKMPQGYVLCVKDYNFMILNNAFLIHKPGIKYKNGDPRRNKIVSKQSKFIRNQLIPELKKIFGIKAGCAL